MNKIMKYTRIGALCMLTGLGGFTLGKVTSNVDRASIHEGIHGNGDAKAIRLHKPFGSDEIFVQRYFNGRYVPIDESYKNYDSKTAEQLKGYVRKAAGI
jgi:hypothetical protein